MAAYLVVPLAFSKVACLVGLLVIDWGENLVLTLAVGLVVGLVYYLVGLREGWLVSRMAYLKVGALVDDLADGLVVPSVV